MAGRNPLKWPEIEQLGRDFYDHLNPALEQIAAGEGDEVGDRAKRQLNRIGNWLSAPCFVTVKLDGTNVGIDDTGLIVGRNFAVEPGQTYQKVDIWKVLDGYAEKAALFRTTLENSLKGESIAQAMLYGELIINSKYDYAKRGINKQWLCFGAVLRPAQSDVAAPQRMVEALRAIGINASAPDERVLIAPNEKLFALFAELGIKSVATGYQPTGAGSDQQWAEHASRTSSLHTFDSLRTFLTSPWMRRFLMPEGNSALGEGVVVASAYDGRLFKFKHGGEELGMVPEQLEGMLRKLASIDVDKQEGDAWPELIKVIEALYLVSTFKPQSSVAAKEPKVAKEDKEAVTAFESALTKVDDLDDIFARGGKDAKASIEKELSAQVTADLMKDYGVTETEAKNRATKAVLRLVGMRFGEWKKKGA